MHWLRTSTPNVPRADGRLEPFQPTYAEHREDACTKNDLLSMQKTHLEHFGKKGPSVKEIALPEGSRVQGNAEAERRFEPTPGTMKINVTRGVRRRNLGGV